MNNIQISLGLAVSNIIGFIPLIKTIQPLHKLKFTMILLNIISSSLMHVSETKHNLGGVMFKKYSKQLLWFDRISSYMSLGYVLLMIYKNPQHWFFDQKMIIYGSLALLFNYVGEISMDKTRYFVFHLGWHCLAYYILNLIIRFDII